MRDRSGLANNKMEFSARNMGRKKALLQEDMTLEHNTENTANDDLETAIGQNQSSTTLNLPPGWKRTTITIPMKRLEQVKDYAYWHRLTLGESFAEILRKEFSSNPVQPRPKKNKILDDE